MAGRPKTMAKRVAPLEETAFQLYLDICAVRPAQYKAREGEEGDDKLAWWWNIACRSVRKGFFTVSVLLKLLEEHAGLDWEELERQRDQQRGLWEEEAADNGEENSSFLIRKLSKMAKI